MDKPHQSEPGSDGSNNGSVKEGFVKRKRNRIVKKSEVTVHQLTFSTETK